MKAIHGSKVNNDKIDSRKISGLLRASMIPQADVYPAAMRSTRDLLRRRNHHARKRADLLSHIQNANAQYNLPEFGRKITYRSHREGIAEPFTDPDVRRSIEVDLELIDHIDHLKWSLESHILKNAKHHDPDTLMLLRTIHGVGPILAMVMPYEIDQINRFPRVQDVASYARLVKCAKESAGKRQGYGGKKRRAFR